MEKKDGWMDGQMDGWMEEWMDARTYVYTHV